MDYTVIIRLKSRKICTIKHITIVYIGHYDYKDWLRLYPVGRKPITCCMNEIIDFRVIPDDEVM